MRKKSFITLFGIITILFLSGALMVQAQETCEKYGVVSVSGGSYKLQNSVWGADTRQCIRSTGGTGFTVSVAEHNQGSVAAYPSIYKGCHWGDCTTSSGMPVRISSIGSANMSFNVSSARPTGDYNVAAECWISPNQDSTNGYNGGAELMIVLDYHGMYPAGSQVGTFNGHSVYYTNIGWNFITYVQTGRSSVNVNMMDFINDAISRGYVDRSWYLHSMEAGFELMRGGQGLTCNSFSFSVSGGGGSTPVPTRTVTRTITRTATRTGGSTPTRTTTSPPGGSICTPSGSISIPYVKDGSGEFCWETTALGNYINSWSLDILEINGTNYTNKWVSASSIAKVNNKYVIHYKSSAAWGHFEAK